MNSLFTKSEILAFLEKRRQGGQDFPDFLPTLPQPLAEEVRHHLRNSTPHWAEMEHLLQTGTRLLCPLQNPDFPGYLEATTLSDLLEISGPDLLLSESAPLGFPVGLLPPGETAPFPENPPFTLGLLGLGDVGGTLLQGLRLLGRDTVKAIRIFDLDEKKRRRYYLEINEISDGTELPPIEDSDLSGLFSTDVLIFTVSAYIPPLDTSLTDVRLVQLEKNREILLSYARMAEEAGFTGHYYIVSDPVDLLCMSLMKDGGIPSYRIRGFGLGVMEARARFIAKELNLFQADLRTYGPHGKGLIVVNSLTAYDEETSSLLTHRTERENFRVRETGFKPYIAPALSSGAISILKALSGQEHLSTWYNGRVFMGARSTWRHGFTRPEKVSLPALRKPLEETEELLLRLSSPD